MKSADGCWDYQESLLWDCKVAEKGWGYLNSNSFADIICEWFPSDEKNEIRDVFLGDLDEESNRQKALVAIKAIRAEMNNPVKKPEPTTCRDLHQQSPAPA